MEQVLNEIDSNIKKELENWYQTNIYDKGYHEYVADEIFRNDRSNASYPSDAFLLEDCFGAFQRLELYWDLILTCPQENDKFTTKSATVGNKKLTYPIGLITAYEVAIAGAVYELSNNIVLMKMKK